MTTKTKKIYYHGWHEAMKGPPPKDIVSPMLLDFGDRLTFHALWRSHGIKPFPGIEVLSPRRSAEWYSW